MLLQILLSPHMFCRQRHDEQKTSRRFHEKKRCGATSDSAESSSQRTVMDSQDSNNRGRSSQGDDTGRTNEEGNNHAGNSVIIPAQGTIPVPTGSGAEAVLTFKVNMDAPQGPDVTILNQGGGDAGREEEHSQDIFGTNEEDTEAFYNRLMQ